MQTKAIFGDAVPYSTPFQVREPAQIQSCLRNYGQIGMEAALATWKERDFRL